MGKPEPYLWLEESEGERALAWARAQTERSVTDLQSDPVYKKLYGHALKILNNPNAITYVKFVEGDRLTSDGQWETTLASYRTKSPKWRTLIDLNSLNKKEGTNWSYHGQEILPSNCEKSLIFLSHGGKDAYEIREFDRKTRTFFEGGFRAPECKHIVQWLNEDTLLIGCNWNNNSLNDSGYPYIVKLWKRGQQLDEATEVFRGKKTDHILDVLVIRSDDNQKVDAAIVERHTGDYEVDYYLLQTRGRSSPARKLPFPKKCDITQEPTGSIEGPAYVKGQLILRLREDWPEQDLLSGDVASFDMKTFIRTGKTKSHLVFRPHRRQSICTLTATRDNIVFSILDNVKSEVKVGKFESGKWDISDLTLAQKGFAEICDASGDSNRVLISVTDFLKPTALLLNDLDSNKSETLKREPAYFDGSRHVVERLEAVSKDGTRIPYSVVMPKDHKFDGSGPTLLCAYGGFQLSLTPRYDGLQGKLWLENGGISVVANIRGGGEFGPAWHQAAIRDNHQKSYDDFLAVSKDLIDRGITTAKRLGIMGASNGGLLVGAALTQAPELYNAAVIQMPVLDMLRFPLMGGVGPAVVAEYGDPNIPHERAALAKTSPYHNLRRDQSYPEVLIETAKNDDRVSPGHARKMAARMMKMGHKVLYHEQDDGGHNGSSDSEKSAKSHALTCTYLHRCLRGDNLVPSP